jgi:preprotein translocase subunit SecG
LIYIVYALHVVTCLFLILVVLLQQGKGADLSVFGGGSTQAAFGARGAATILHKLTVAFFVLFMITTVSIGVLQRGRRAASVMQGVATTTEQPAAAEPVASPAAGVPAAPAPAAASDAQAPPAQDPAAANAPPAAPDAPAPQAPPVSGSQPSGDAQPQSN